MDPFTILALLGAGIGALSLRKQAQETAALEELSSPATIEPDTQDLTSTLAKGAIALLATAGVIRIVSNIAERREREQQRYDNFQALKNIALGIREMGAEDLNGIADADFLPLFEDAIGVPNKVSLSFSPSWERGATSVALMLAERRNHFGAPETIVELDDRIEAGRLPPDPRVEGTGLRAQIRRGARAVIVKAYYRDKQFKREGLL